VILQFLRRKGCRLKKVPTIREVLTESKRNFQKLGAGSGRLVYRVSSRTILKISPNSLGVEQTKEEATTSFSAVLFNLPSETSRDFSLALYPLGRGLTATESAVRLGVPFRLVEKTAHDRIRDHFSDKLTTDLVVGNLTKLLGNKKLTLYGKSWLALLLEEVKKHDPSFLKKDWLASRHLLAFGNSLRLIDFGATVENANRRRVSLLDKEVIF